MKNKEVTMTILNGAFVIGFILLLAIGFVMILSLGLAKQEAYECQKWEAEAKQFKDFYYTDWQKEQCGIR